MTPPALLLGDFVSLPEMKIGVFSAGTCKAWPTVQAGLPLCTDNLDLQLLLDKPMQTSEALLRSSCQSRYLSFFKVTHNPVSDLLVWAEHVMTP